MDDVYNIYKMASFNRKTVVAIREKIMLITDWIIT